jgi:hypothetical protein
MQGKSVEVLPFQQGRSALEDHRREATALPLRVYGPLIEGTIVGRTGSACCRKNVVRAEVDASTLPWTGRIGVSLAGFAELRLDEVVARTVAIARRKDGDQYDET